MAVVKTIVTGIDEIDRKLARLPHKVQGKAVRPAMRGGMKLVLASMKAEVPVDTGLTKANVKLRTPKHKKRGAIELEVRVLADPGLVKTTRAGKRYFYPALVQYGSKGRPANRFGTRAYDKAGEPARRQTIRLLEAGLDREIKAL